MILSFSHVSFKQSPMFCLAIEQAMSQSTTFCAGNAAMCFLPYVLRSERTETAVRSSEGYVLRSQVNRICVGERRRTLRNVGNEVCQRTCRRQEMRDAGLAQIGIFLQKHVFSLGGEEILPQNLKKTIKSIVKVRELNLKSEG